MIDTFDIDFRFWGSMARTAHPLGEQLGLFGVDVAEDQHVVLFLYPNNPEYDHLSFVDGSNGRVASWHPEVMRRAFLLGCDFAGGLGQSDYERRLYQRVLDKRWLNSEYQMVSLEED
jgi:hypothetical protein